MATEGVTLDITADAIDAIADIAVLVNTSVENIGARRLQTVMERVLDDISFTATDRSGETLTIDGDYVQKNIGDLAQQHRSQPLHSVGAGLRVSGAAGIRARRRAPRVDGSPMW